MSDDNNPPTLDLADQIEDLPEEDDSMGQHPANDQTLVTLIALNHAHDTIKLTGTKTILGRNIDKCTSGAILTGRVISGTHCQISSRSMKDADAAIWITDLSSNGVWVNEKRISKNVATKIYNRDIISFTPGVPGKDSHAYMLMDKRGQGAKEPTKRPLEVEEPRLDTLLSGDKPEEKKQKLDQGKTNSPTDSASNEEKEKEDTAFEREFECGICHEIMHRALVLQPCLHSFCRECCKIWLRNNKICPTCRQGVTRTKRDFKLNNLIALFLKTRPHMARDDVDEEDEGAESDTSNIMPEPPRRHHRNLLYNDVDGHYEDDDEEDEEDEDDDYVDDNNNNGFPLFFFRQPTTCPCCLPDNNTGYICPPDVRLVPLPDDTNFQDYMLRRLVQRGHSQCTDCRNHIPLVSDTVPAATANRFQCKMCLTPNCGCSMHSVDDKIANRASIYHFLNPHEIRVILNYLDTHGKTTTDVWREVKAGIDSGTFFYLGTAEHPVLPPSLPGGDGEDDDTRDNGEGSSSGVNNNTTQAPGGSSSADPALALAPAPAPPLPAPNGLLPLPIPPAAPGMFGVAPPVDHHLQAARGRTVTSSDNLCHQCSVKFFNNGPLYQWRKNLDPAQLPANVTVRESCWYGRECRTQHNLANQAHAMRLNHICEKTNRRR